MSEAFRDLMLPGEQLIWTARPKAWAGFTGGTFVVAVFGVLAVAWGIWSFVGSWLAWRSTFGTAMPMLSFVSARTLFFPALAATGGAFAVHSVFGPYFRLRHEIYGLSAARAFCATGPAARRVAIVAAIGPRGVVAVERLGRLAVLVFESAVSGEDSDHETGFLRFENLTKPDFEAALVLLKAHVGPQHG